MTERGKVQTQLTFKLTLSGHPNFHLADLFFGYLANNMIPRIDEVPASIPIDICPRVLQL